MPLVEEGHWSFTRPNRKWRSTRSCPKPPGGDAVVLEGEVWERTAPPESSIVWMTKGHTPRTRGRRSFRFLQGVKTAWQNSHSNPSSLSSGRGTSSGPLGLDDKEFNTMVSSRTARKYQRHRVRFRRRRRSTRVPAGDNPAWAPRTGTHLPRGSRLQQQPRRCPRDEESTLPGT